MTQSKIEAIIWDWKGTLEKHGEKNLFPESEEVLRNLYPEIKMAVISKVAPKIPIQDRLDDISKLGKYLSVIIADYVKTPEQYIGCMKKLGVKPENTLCVDDRMDRGIQIGNALGCQTAWIKTGKWDYIVPTEETGQPTYQIHNLQEVITILNK